MNTSTSEPAQFVSLYDTSRVKPACQLDEYQMNNVVETPGRQGWVSVQQSFIRAFTPHSCANQIAVIWPCQDNDTEVMQ